MNRIVATAGFFWLCIATCEALAAPPFQVLWKTVPTPNGSEVMLEILGPETQLSIFDLQPSLGFRLLSQPTRFTEPSSADLLLPAQTPVAVFLQGRYFSTVAVKVAGQLIFGSVPTASLGDSVKADDVDGHHSADYTSLAEYPSTIALIEKKIKKTPEELRALAIDSSLDPLILESESEPQTGLDTTLWMEVENIIVSEDPEKEKRTRFRQTLDSTLVDAPLFLGNEKISFSPKAQQLGLEYLGLQLHLARSSNAPADACARAGQAVRFLIQAGLKNTNDSLGLEPKNAAVFLYGIVWGKIDVCQTELAKNQFLLEPLKATLGALNNPEADEEAWREQWGIPTMKPGKYKGFEIVALNPLDNTWSAHIGNLGILEADPHSKNGSAYRWREKHTLNSTQVEKLWASRWK